MKGDNLRDYTLNVTRDCVTDLANTTYTAPAGRLLVSVLSAKPSSFVLMVTPAITHIKENLRHPKAPMHTQDLLKILHVILETRILLVETEMSAEDREDFAAVDPTFKSLYADVFKTAVQLGAKSDASYDDIKVATQAVPGAGALICQQPAKTLGLPSESTGGCERLLPDGTCSEIAEALFNILTNAATSSSRSTGSDDLVNETTQAVQRAVRIYPSAFKPMVALAIEALDSSWRQGANSAAIAAFAQLSSQLAFIGCSELPKTSSDGLEQFLYFVQTLLSSLFTIIDNNGSPKVWCAVAAAIQSAVRYFNDACLVSNPSQDLPPLDDSWAQKVAEKYPQLSQLGHGSTEDSQISISTHTSVAEIRNEFLLLSLFIVRQLYRRATKIAEGTSEPVKQALELSGDFRGSDEASEYQYLHLISVLAGFVVHELSETQQTSVGAEKYLVNLFHDDFTTSPGTQLEEQASSTSWSWLVLARPNILSLGLLESLRPSVVARLVGTFSSHPLYGANNTVV